MSRNRIHAILSFRNHPIKSHNKKIFVFISSITIWGELWLRRKLGLMSCYCLAGATRYKPTWEVPFNMRTLLQKLLATGFNGKYLKEWTFKNVGEGCMVGLIVEVISWMASLRRCSKRVCRCRMEGNFLPEFWFNIICYRIGWNYEWIYVFYFMFWFLVMCLKLELNSLLILWYIQRTSRTINLNGRQLFWPLHQMESNK